MKFGLITDHEQLDELAPFWDELARHDSRDGFCRTFVWYKAWLEHIRRDAQPFVVTARRDDRLVGIAPLCRLRYRDLGFRLRALAWGGREVVSGDFLDFVVEPDVRHDVVPAMLEFLCEEASRQWSVLVMSELVDGGNSYNAVELMGVRRQLRTRRQEERICPYIALPKTFDEYLGGLGSSTRYHIRRRMREAAKKGATVVTYSSAEEIGEHLDTLVRLHLARWNRDALPGTFGRPGFTDFLRQVLRQPPLGAEFRLYELVANGAPVASLLTFYYGESALYYQAGWDPSPETAGLSPGVVLMAASIRDAIDHGKRYYEFLRGDEAYKSRWTKTYRTTVTVLVARNWTARRFLQVAQLKDWAKGRLSSRSTAPDALDGDAVEGHASESEASAAGLRRNPTT